MNNRDELDQELSNKEWGELTQEKIGGVVSRVRRAGAVFKGVNLDDIFCDQYISVDRSGPSKLSVARFRLVRKTTGSVLFDTCDKLELRHHAEEKLERALAAQAEVEGLRADFSCQPEAEKRTKA